MGTSERRDRERNQRMDSIIDAAEKVIFSSTLEDATMAEIAKTAELSKGLLYFYFDSKEALYAAVSARGAKIVERMFQEAIANCSDGWEQLEAIGDAYIRFAHEYGDYFNSMLKMHVKLMSEPVGSFGIPAEPIALVAEVVSRLIDEGVVRSDLDPHQTAMVLWAQTHGLILVSKMHPDHADFDGLRKLSGSFIRAALLSPEFATG